MSHLRPEELSATLDDALHGEARERAERHLAGCASCRDALSALADQDASLRSALTHDPGEAYFQDFAARVEDRIRAAGLKGAQARLDREGFWGWLTSPRRLAWAGAVAAIIGGAGIVMLTGRHQRLLLESPRIVERGRQVQEINPPQPEQERIAAGAQKDVGAGAKESKLADQASLSQEEVGALREAPQGAPAPQAEPPARGEASTGAAPMRAQEVRRSVSGEDVPVSGQSRSFAPAPASPTTGSRSALSAKPQAASPMEQQPSANLAPRDRDASTRLCGRVVDARQRPVPGATVALADRGLVTNAGPDGRFCFDAAAGLHELSVMAVGYEATRLQVRIEGESSEALVTLRPVSVLDGPLAKAPAVKPTSPSMGTLASPQGKAAGDATYGYLEQPASTKASAALERARIASHRADSVRTASAFDAAAAAWAKVVPFAASGPPRSDAQHEVAEARFRAWQLAPTSPRAKSARGAIDAFLEAEPAGARRDQVTGWRAQLPR